MKPETQFNKGSKIINKILKQKKKEKGKNNNNAATGASYLRK